MSSVNRNDVDKIDQSEEPISLEDSWKIVCRFLTEKFGKNTMKNWINKLVPKLSDVDRVELQAPNKFVRDWITSYYLNIIQSTWHHVDPSRCKYHINITESRSDDRNEHLTKHKEAGKIKDISDPNVLKEKQQHTHKINDAKTKDSRKSRVGADKKDPHTNDRAKVEDGTKTERESLSLTQPWITGETEDQDSNFQGINDRFTFDNFVVAKSNELAYNAALHVSKSEKIVYNPLFIYGDVGLGKTHLMHALGNYLRQNQIQTRRQNQKKVVYMTAERFMYEFISALRLKDIMGFKRKFRSCKVLMIDDIQFIAGKESTQDEFFHTFNTLFDNKCQIVISGDCFPMALSGIEERIKSRLGGGLVVHIQSADYELRLAILQNKLDKINELNEANNYPRINIDISVMEFLAHNVISNIRELEGALTRLLAHHELCKKPINVDLAQESLSDLLKIRSKVPTVDEVKQKVAEHYGIKFTDLSSDRRYRQIVRPRQVAIYLCKQFTKHSLNSLGNKFGGRDHTTMKHAVSVIEKLISKDRDLAEDIRSLNNVLRGNFR